MSYMEKVIREFLVESYENLDQLDRDLVTLESEPGSRPLLDRIFRTIHTIKGTSVFLGFTKLESLSHVGENLLHRLREGQLEMSPAIADALLALVDTLRQIIASVESTQQEGDTDVSLLIDRMTGLLEAAQSAEHTPPEFGAGAAEMDEPSETVAVCAPPPAERVAEPEPLAVAVMPAAAPIPAAVPAAALPLAAAEPVVPPAAPSAAPQNVASTPPPAAKENSEGKTAVSDTTIRVDVTLLDRLMNLVGELVLTRNQILQFTNASEDSSLLGTVQRLNLVTTELQEGVMKTRMQPIGNIWSKFPRVIRDLAVSLQKEVELELEGKDTELDKTIIEAIKDPLTHVIRNAVDHGIELPEVRRAAGKPSHGTLTLRAFHEGGQVNIEIQDDGGGLNLERIRAKAVEKNLISAQQASRLSDRDTCNLIFLPGFSTAEKVTNVSGRGVGMDVVKSNIEKIGGTVDLSSVFGKGTTLRMKIPLTLAIIPALIVTSRGDRFAIPQVSLVELVRLEEDQIASAIEYVHDAPVYRLRGQLLPLASLDTVLGLHEGSFADRKGPVNIVVVQTDTRQFGLMVDAINDTEEIVVKPMSKQLKGLDTYAGATIMGDGRIALILDITGIAIRANLNREPAGGRASASEHGLRAGEGGEEQSFLLCRMGTKGRAAIPLGRVARLEEFPRNVLEHSGMNRVVQYRGEIMPLMHVRELIGGERWQPQDEDLFHTVVFTLGEHNLGLVVDGILDIVESAVEVQAHARRLGVLGAAVLQGRVTEMLDIDACLARIRGGAPGEMGSCEL